MANDFPFMKLYTADWRNDTRALCPASKGIWWDILTYAHDNKTGEVNGTIDQLARMTGATTEEMKKAIEEIEQFDIGKVRCQEVVRGGVSVKEYTIRNRRLWHEWRERKQKRDAQRRSRARRKGKSQDDVRPMSDGCQGDCHADVTEQNLRIPES